MTYKKDRGFPVPEVPEGYTKTVCFSGEIPDLPEYRAALNAAVLGLTKWLAWEKKGIGNTLATRSAQSVASVLIETYQIEDCGDMCSCNSSCLCNVVTILQQMLDLQISIDAPVVVIPPSNPTENLPQIDEPSNQPRVDAALCELSKSYVRSMFSMIYQAQIEDCVDNTPDWQTIARDAATVLFVGAALATGPITASVLLISGAVATGLANGPEFFGFTLFGDPCDGTGDPVPQTLQRIYGCQLWQSLLNDGLSWDVWRTAFDCPNPEAIAFMPLVTNDPPAQADQETRDILKLWFTQPDTYQSFILQLATLSENEYLDLELCNDCTGCGNAVNTLFINEFTDPHIIDISPPPTDIVSNSEWQWNPGTKVTFTFDTVYCMANLQFDIVRGATITLPSNFAVEIQGQTFSGGAGGFGTDPVFINFLQTGGKIMTITPNSTNFPFRMKLTQGFNFKLLPEYIDCP